MFTLSRTTQQRHAPTRRPRRGIALVFVLIFVIAMAALAMSSIFMASNANLLAKSYDRERDLKFAAEWALSVGKSRVNADPTILTMRARWTPPSCSTSSSREPTAYRSLASR
jgi:Tfp pilus assembly protein PilX